MLRHRRSRMSSHDSSSSSSAASATSKKKSKEPRGRSKSKKRTEPNKYELIDKKKPSSSTSESSKEAPKKSPSGNTPAKVSPSVKKKTKEFSVKAGKFLMQLLMVALFLVLPITLLLCLATNSMQSDNTWLAFVAHLYISVTCVLITLAAFLLKGLLLLPLYLAFFTINVLLWLFNCNETVVDQIVTTAATGPDLQV